MAIRSKYAIGLDYGTNSARCLIVRVEDGAEVGTAVYAYRLGESGIVLDRREPDLARQHPSDYVEALKDAIPRAIQAARDADENFSIDAIIGIGVDTTASTPMPITALGQPLAFESEFQANPNAMAWLWKDHTSTKEASEITRRAAELHPEYLRKCGGVYSSEWFFSKIWHCLRVAPDVFKAAHSWIEIADWIPGLLCDRLLPDQLKVGICAAGHKGMFHEDWGGYPAKSFLAGLAPELGDLRDRLPKKAYPVNERAGGISTEWASKLGLHPGIPVAVGAIDAHLGAVGSGIRPGTLVKILGTSTCDMMVWPESEPLADIPGVAGIVPGSILPGLYGIEAGQAAVGDLFNWYVQTQQPGGRELGSHEALSEGAARLRAGESGLLALDWNNGNRCVLGDQRLSGLLLGQTLQTRPEEIYRALIEATAFGALMIINRLQEYGVQIEEIVNCGGIAEKNPLIMQIYADVSGRPMKIARSPQASALGAAICGAVVAGADAGGYATFDVAMRKMTAVKTQIYYPEPEAHSVYRALFKLYQDLHDAFGMNGWQGNLSGVMKQLIEIRTNVRTGKMAGA